MRQKTIRVMPVLKTKTTLAHRVDFREVRKRVLAFLKENPIPALAGMEEAVVSHWIQNPDDNVFADFRDIFVGVVVSGAKRHSGDLAAEAGNQKLFFKMDVPFPSPTSPTFTFIDLFAGIGGFRMALQKAGGKCVFSSEWEKEAQKTYERNYGEVPFGDITQQEVKNFIPAGFDILCAGFPCQAFSLAGQRKGFKDDYKGLSRGTLFFDVLSITQKHKPKVIFCENVKGLTIHDKQRTFKIIIKALAEAGYTVHAKILNSKYFGVPQNRERVYIVAFRNDIDSSRFAFPTEHKKTVTLRTIIEEKPVSAKYYLSTQYLLTLRNHRARHEAKGHGFGYVIRDLDDVSGAVVCGGMGREGNLIIDDRLEDFTPVTQIKGEVNREGIRKMTPREWARLQGFDESFMLAVSDVHLYKQFGNAVTVSVIKAIWKQISEVLDEQKNR